MAKKESPNGEGGEKSRKGTRFYNIRMTEEELRNYLRGPEKGKVERDPYVAKALEHLKLGKAEKRYRDIMGSIRAQMDSAKENQETRKKAINDYYSHQINLLPYTGAGAANVRMKDAAINTGHSIAKRGEWAARKILRFPLEFIARYSGGEIDATPLIDENPDEYLVDGLFEGVKETAATRTRDLDAEKVRLEIERDIRLSNLDSEYKRIMSGYESLLEESAMKTARYLKTYKSA